jgi:hypothetical protein
MVYINGYKYINEDDALHAQNICRINEGLPKANGTTLQAVDVQFTSLNTPNFWYIVFCDESQILGEPTTFEVIQPEFNLHPN